MIEIGKLGTVAHEMKKIAQQRAEIVNVAGPVFAVRIELLPGGVSVDWGGVGDRWVRRFGVDGDFSDGEMEAGVTGKEAAVGIATHHSFALRSFIQGADPRERSNPMFAELGARYAAYLNYLMEVSATAEPEARIALNALSLLNSGD